MTLDVVLDEECITTYASMDVSSMTRFAPRTSTAHLHSPLEQVKVPWHDWQAAPSSCMEEGARVQLHTNVREPCRLPADKCRFNSPAPGSL